MKGPEKDQQSCEKRAEGDEEQNGDKDHDVFYAPPDEVVKAILA